MLDVLSLVRMKSVTLVVIYLILLIIFLSSKVVNVRIEAKIDERRGPFIDMGLQTLVNVATIILPFIYLLSSTFDAADYSLPDPINVIGFAGLILAILVSTKGHHDLGRNFTLAPGWKRDHQLVTNGIYSYIRHPLYLSFLLWGVCIPLVVHNFIVGLAPLACISLFIFVRIPIEETMLIEEFGEQYRSYMTRTGRLVPRMGRRNS
jgi:protein-S-isoprenylcysteine O-methyltransferase Ste14